MNVNASYYHSIFPITYTKIGNSLPAIDDYGGVVLNGLKSCYGAEAHAVCLHRDDEGHVSVGSKTYIINVGHLDPIEYMNFEGGVCLIEKMNPFEQNELTSHLDGNTNYCDFRKKMIEICSHSITHELAEWAREQIRFESNLSCS